MGIPDDQNLITESLCTFLSNYADDMLVIGVAKDGKEAIALANEHHPDIILMDVLMPGMNGDKAVSVIKEKHPGIKIIMLSTYDEDVRSSLLAGASGYLLKAISPTELITAIRAVVNNVIQISPEIVRHLELH